MLGEVISIGDELSSGQRLDTNTQWLSQRLAEVGVSVLRHTTIADDLDACVAAFRNAAQSCQVIVVTGGLGPTEDDLTRQALAAAFHRELELDTDSLTKIQRMFEERGREMPASNRVQAMFPSGSAVVPNDYGTAPGIDLPVNDNQCRFFALPGVPAEMKQMWEQTVVSSLDAFVNKTGQSAGALHFHTMKAFGIGESDVELRLPGLISRDRDPKVGITVSRATITLRIAGRADSDESFAKLIAPTVAEIENGLGDLLFGTGNDRLETVVAQHLLSQQTSVATLEIGGASFLGDCLANVLGKSDDNYRGGLCFRNVDQADNYLRKFASLRNQSTERPNAATLSQTAEYWTDLCTAVREHFDADYGLVVAGYPGETEMASSNGTFPVNIALASDSGAHHETRNLGGHPDVLPSRIAKFGLDALRRFSK
ncbi:MAG TPA: competence/damage-inducible protein A [Planctomycetaceae bacterium]|nr:competence/damage-inducible protein A [Planctomycetaceae bacterium]